MHRYYLCSAEEVIEMTNELNMMVFSKVVKEIRINLSSYYLTWFSPTVYLL